MPPLLLLVRELRGLWAKAIRRIQLTSPDADQARASTVAAGDRAFGHFDRHSQQLPHYGHSRFRVRAVV